MTAKIKVYGGWEQWGVPDFSPACLKVKTYLRMVGIEYEARRGDPRKGPTKKIPYIDDGTGTLIGDSGFILDHLAKKHGNPLDGKLGASDRAIGHSARRLVEDSLYWSMLWTRWVDDGNAAEIKKTFDPVMPPVIGGVVFGIIRSGLRKAAWAQGISRHSPAHIHHIGMADVDCASTLLGDKPFLLGAEPTSFDATFYAHLANVFTLPLSSPIAMHAKSLANVVAYCDCMRARYWQNADTIA